MEGDDQLQIVIYDALAKTSHGSDGRTGPVTQKLQSRRTLAVSDMQSASIDWWQDAGERKRSRINEQSDELHLISAI